MTTRDRVLDSLRVASPCRSSWDDMQGDARRRFCAECGRHVYDLAQLTAREAAGLVAATGGRLCARVTRDPFGRLVTLPSPAPEPLGSPPGSRRSAPLAAAVAAVLGLAGAAAAHGSEPPAAPAVEQGAGERPADGAQQRMESGVESGVESAGGSLSGTLATDGGEPIARAEVQLLGLLDGGAWTVQTDERGNFTFTSLPAGIYTASAKFQQAIPLAEEENVLLRAGEAGWLGLTVPSETWRRIVTGEPVEGERLMGETIVVLDDSLRKLYLESTVVAFGTVRRSSVVHQGEHTSEVRTDLVLSSVVKGKVGERAIELSHERMELDPPESRLQPGDRVLAFLEPRGADRYSVHEPSDSGLKKLSEAEAAAYGRRLEALIRLARRGSPPADLVEWLVGTAEDPATRGEAVRDLIPAAEELAGQAEKRGVPVDRYAQNLREVVSEHLADGGPEVQASPSVLGAFLTDGQRERLTAALLHTTRMTEADLALYRLVGRWHADRALPWLLGRIRSGEPAEWSVRGALEAAAQDLGDESLQDLVQAGSRTVDGLAEKLIEARDDGERRRREAELRAAEEELRQRFLAALGGRQGKGD